MESKIPIFLFKDFTKEAETWFKNGSQDINTIDKQTLLEFGNAYTLAMNEMLKMPEFIHSDLLAYSLTAQCFLGKFDKDLSVHTYNILTKFIANKLKDKFETKVNNGKKAGIQ